MLFPLPLIQAWQGLLMGSGHLQTQKGRESCRWGTEK